MSEHGDPPAAMDRRALIQKAVAAGAAGLVAPALITSVRSPAAAASVGSVTVTRLTTFSNAGNTSSSFTVTYTTLADDSLVLLFVSCATRGIHLPSISSGSGVTAPTLVTPQPPAFYRPGTERDGLFVFEQVVIDAGPVTTTLRIENRLNVVVHVVEVDPSATGSPTVVARVNEHGPGALPTITAISSANVEVAFVALRADPENTTALFVTEPAGFVGLGATTFQNETSGAGDLAGFSAYSLSSQASATASANAPSSGLLVWATASIEVALP